MVFSSTIFIFVFLPICLFGYYVVKNEFRNAFLLLMSILFYAWGEPRYVVLLLCSILINYFLALGVQKDKKLRKCCLFLDVAANLGILFVFKYLCFTLHNINLLTGSALKVPSIVLPIGISFFTFQALSYVLDVYFGTTKAQKNLINVALYIALFPQLVAGPIVRYNSVEKQIMDRVESIALFSEGVKRFVIGLFKKIVISNMIAVLVDEVFAMQYDERTVLLCWVGIIAYCLQLYYDFSGYSDMAIGLGKMFGFEFEENFDYPYIATSVGEFWRRWHISLSSWLRDYLYTPVFRSIKKKKKFSIQTSNVIALFVTWTLCGIWHGANWTYLVFGVYYFIFIAGEQIIKEKKKKYYKNHPEKKKKPNMLNHIGDHIYTLIVVLFGQLLFRSESLTMFGQYVKGMFGANHNMLYTSDTLAQIQEYGVILIVGILFSMPIFRKLKEFIENKITNQICKTAIESIFYLVIFVVGISFTVSSTYNPFIYFNF